MKPTNAACCGLALLALAVPARAQTDAGTPSLTPNSTTNAPIPQVLKLPGGAQRGSISTDKAAYKHGQPVRITFRVANPTGKPVTYNFATGQKYDVTVQDAVGTTVWDWAQGQAFSQNLTAVTIGPKSSQTFTAVWNGRGRQGQPFAAGTYTVKARLTSDNHPAVTGGVLVNVENDPNNMGVPTKTPAETGAIQQVNVTPAVSASKTIVIK